MGASSDDPGPIRTHGPRFIFYANELIGLGHLRRTLAIATRLAATEASPSSLILTGSPIEPFRLPAGVDTVKLPGGTRDEEGHVAAQRLELDSDELWSLRSSIALASATGFKPDVAIVDKLPFGQGGELRPTLDALKADAHCRLVLGLRDIDDSPENVRRKWSGDMRAAIEHYYDAILVYGPESTPDAIDCMGWDDLDVPLHHVGYVGTEIPAAGPSDLHGDYVLATAGGGFDGFELLATFAAAVRLRPLPCRAVMVTGPLMGQRERRRLIELTSGLDIEVHELRRDMEHVITCSTSPRSSPPPPTSRPSPASRATPARRASGPSFRSRPPCRAGCSPSRRSPGSPSGSSRSARRRCARSPRHRGGSPEGCFTLGAHMAPNVKHARTRSGSTRGWVRQAAYVTGFSLHPQPRGAVSRGGCIRRPM